MNMQVTTDSDAFMRRYGALMDEGIRSGAVDAGAIAAMFADHFVGAGTAGVMGGEGGAGLARAIAAGIDGYRRIGATGFVVEAVAVTAIDPLHDMARVSWRFDYRRPGDGQEGAIRFQNVYLLTRAAGGTKIFAWITADEQAALRAHGLA